MRQNQQPWGFAAGITSIFVLVAALFYLGQSHIKHVEKTQQSLINIKEKTSLAFAMRDAIRKRSFSLAVAQTMEDVFDRDAERERFRSYARDFIVARGQLLALGISPSERAILDGFQGKVRAGQQVVEDAMDGVVDGLEGPEFEALIAQAIRHQSWQYEDLDRFVNILHQLESERLEDARRESERADLQLFAVGGLMLVVFAVIAVIIVVRERRHVALLIQEVANRENAEQKVRLLNATLEDRVRRRTRQLKKSEERTRTILETAVDGIITINHLGVVDSFNIAAEHIFGYQADEVIGHNINMLMPEPYAHEHDGYLQRHLATGINGLCGSGEREVEGLRKDGSLVPLDLAISSMELDGEIYFTGILRDITERKLTEERLRSAREVAETSNRAKTELIANMSHELRTPLNAIIGFSQAMLGEVFGPLGSAKYQEYATDIHSSGDHLLELINDILDVSAVENSKLQLNEHEIDLARQVRAVLRLISPRANQGRVTVTDNVPDGLPHLYADERRVKQILLNLVSNAVKFTKAGGEVQVGATQSKGGGLTVTVTDTGIGMDEAGIEKALSPFGQVDSGLNRKHEGTGLGLPLSKSLAEQHGASLEIESTPGAGSTVTVRFPAERVISADAFQAELI